MTRRRKNIGISDDAIETAVYSQKCERLMSETGVGLSAWSIWCTQIE